MELSKIDALQYILLDFDLKSQNSVQATYQIPSTSKMRSIVLQALYKRQDIIKAIFLFIAILVLFICFCCLLLE